MSSTYEKEVGKGKNKTKVTLTSWQVKVQSIRKLNITKAAKTALAPVEPQASETPF